MTPDERTYQRVAKIYADAIAQTDYALDYPWQVALLAVYQAGYDAAVAGRAIV